MASATAVAPPATDPNYRKALEPAGPPLRSASDSLAVIEQSDKEVRPHAETGTSVGGGAAASAGRGARRLSVILHGKRADEPDVRAAVAALRSEGVRVDVKVTWESGDVEKFVKDIVRAHSADTIVAAGGDGTLNEVVAALIKVRAPRNMAVGLMPMGTSNDFAAVTGIPQDLEGALRLCCRSDNLRPLDVGLLNGEVFMNTATLGASSELGSETSHEAKKLLGPAAYLVKGVSHLTNYTAVPVRMRFPDPDHQHHQQQSGENRDNQREEQREGLGAAGAAPHGADRERARGGAKKGTGRTVEVREEVLNITVGNSRQLASMLQACPDALLDDGLLDITYVTGAALTSASAVVGEILSRGLDAASPPNVRMMRVPWLEVELVGEGTDSWPANRDGEPVPPARRFLLEALPQRVTMHLPDAARPLLREGADPRVNAPVISANRIRKGVFKAMLAQVRRFRRVIPGSRPWWQGAALGLLGRAPLLALGFAAGYAVRAAAEAERKADNVQGGGGGSSDVTAADAVGPRVVAAVKAGAEAAAAEVAGTETAGTGAHTTAPGALVVKAVAPEAYEESGAEEAKGPTDETTAEAKGRERRVRGWHGRARRV